MNADSLSESLDNAWQRLSELFQKASATNNWEVIEELMNELNTALEELHVAAEELHEQSVSLAAAREIAESERKRYRDLFEFAPDGYIVTNHEGVIQEANQAAGKLFNTRADRLKGKPLSIFIAPNQYPQFFERLKQMAEISLDRLHEWDVTILPRGSSPMPVAITVEASFDENKRVRALRWMIRDIQEFKLAQEQLEKRSAQLVRSNAELEQFAYIAAHDLQEPLRIVSTYTQLLESESKGMLGPEQEAYLGFIVESADKMLSLIRDVLTYSTASGGGQNLARVDAAAAVAESIASLEIAIKESGAEIIVGELPIVSADRAMCVQLFINLIGNAIKFHGAGLPQIRVSAERQDEQWLFSITDNGIGIEESYKERIFGMFQRLHPTSEYPGNGIGLAVCKKIVEHLGGRIWIESELSKGTTVFFTLQAVL